MSTKIKVKNLTTMIYNAEEGFFSNGDFMIRADIIELDNPCLQSLLNSKISFNIGNAIDIKNDTCINIETIKEYYGEVPKMKRLIPQHTCDDDLLADTDLMYVGPYDRLKQRVFTKDKDASHITYVNNDYLKLFRECGLPSVQFYQISTLSQIKIMSKDECIGLLMPVQLRDNIIQNMFYTYHKQIQDKGLVVLK